MANESELRALLAEALPELTERKYRLEAINSDAAEKIALLIACITAALAEKDGEQVPEISAYGESDLFVERGIMPWLKIHTAEGIPPGVAEFRYGDRVIGRIVNIGTTAPLPERKV